MFNLALIQNYLTLSFFIMHLIFYLTVADFAFISFRDLLKFET